MGWTRRFPISKFRGRSILFTLNYRRRRILHQGYSTYIGHGSKAHSALAPLPTAAHDKWNCLNFLQQAQLPLLIAPFRFSNFTADEKRLVPHPPCNEKQHLRVSSVLILSDATNFSRVFADFDHSPPEIDPESRRKQLGPQPDGINMLPDGDATVTRF